MSFWRRAWNYAREYWDDKWAPEDSILPEWLILAPLMIIFGMGVYNVAALIFQGMMQSIWAKIMGVILNMGNMMARDALAYIANGVATFASAFLQPFIAVAGFFAQGIVAVLNFASPATNYAMSFITPVTSTVGSVLGQSAVAIGPYVLGATVLGLGIVGIVNLYQATIGKVLQDEHHEVELVTRKEFTDPPNIPNINPRATPNAPYIANNIKKQLDIVHNDFLTYNYITREKFAQIIKNIQEALHQPANNQAQLAAYDAELRDLLQHVQAYPKNYLLFSGGETDDPPADPADTPAASRRTRRRGG